MIWRGGFVVWLCAGCTVPAASEPADSDTALGPDEEESDTPPVETEPPDDTPEGDTGWIDGDDDTGGHGGGGTTVIGCHPYDPVESVVGWERRYDVVYGTDPGLEIHTGAGMESLPGWVAGTWTQAYGYDIEVKNAGDANSSGHQYVLCDVNGTGAFDIGWVRSFQTGIFGGTTVSLRAVPRQARVYLPAEVELFGWSMTDITRYDLTQVGGTLGGSSQAELKNDWTVLSFGMEQVVVPAGTFSDAMHINVLYTEEKIAAGGIFGAFFGIFDALLGALLGYDQGATSITAQSDRWYVRGIGLVKEVTIDFTDGSPIVTKELKHCDGLPDCP